jgi:hypothetical protein
MAQKIMEYGGTAYNIRLLYAAFRRLGYEKLQSGFQPFVQFFCATYFCARKNASHFSLSGAKKRQ